MMLSAKLGEKGAYVQVRGKCCLEKKRNPTNVPNPCRGEPYVRLLTETEIKPMSDCNGKP